MLFLQGKNEDVIVVALGGSIVVSKNIQAAYLKRFKTFLEKHMQDGRKFVIVVGGGSTARKYQQAAQKVMPLTDEDRDWLGVHSTRLNAHLLRTIFRDKAYPVVLDNPDKKIWKRDFKKYALFVASGSRPGWSTDYIAFRLAHRFGARRVVIATKVPYIYDRDVAKDKNAKPIENLTWAKYEKLLPSKKWTPGMKSPVDPVATSFARENKMSCILLRGTNLTNFEKYLQDGEFKGTVIVPE